MRKIIRSHAPESIDEGGPVRKLAAAALAVMEPVESRILQSVSPASVVNHQVSTITAKYETQAVSHAGNAAGDSAIWVNIADPSKSAIIGTDSKGAINVYDLSGNLVSSLTENAYTNVDLRSNFQLGGKSVTLVVATNITQNKVSVFTLDPSTRQLTYIAARNIKPTVDGQVTSLTMYQSADTGKTFVLVSTKTGAVEEFELTDNGKGKVLGKSVRTFQVGSDVEGMVADDDTGALYVSERNVGIWKYGAEPTDAAVRVQVDSVGSDGHLSDAEGLTIYKTSSGGGYLIASSQGSSDYVVYDRGTGEYVTRFAINESNGNGTTSSVGIAVTNAPLTTALPEGTLVVQDSNTSGNQDFKIVSWGDIARSQAIPLTIDDAQSAVAVSTPASSSTTLSVTSLSLFQARSNNKLVTITNGTVIDLADFEGVKLNLRAATTGTVGSVKFSVNGNSNYHVENYNSYDIAGTNGVWSPTTGTYTITVTAYSAHRTKGDASQSYTVTFTIIDSSDSSTPVVTNSTTLVSTVPAAAKNVTATVDSDQITVDWSAGDSSATGYYVERSTDGKNFTKVATTSSTEYVDTDVTTGTTYTYRVTAYNATGSAAVSATAAATIAKPSTTVDATTSRPSASNTGVKAGTTLTNVSNFKASSNTTYSNLHISGQVTLTGLSNVTLINCVIDGGGSTYGVRCDNGTNITIQNCEIKNVSAAGIYGSGFKAISNYIHQSGGDGIKPGSDALIQGNYITELGWNSPDAHADGIQIRGGSNIRIIGNFFDMPNGVANTKANTALFLQLDATDVTFEGNWVNGGNFGIHAYSDAAGGNATIKILNNTFYTGSTQYGFGSIGTGVVWSGNTNEFGVTVSSSDE